MRGGMLERLGCGKLERLGGRECMIYVPVHLRDRRTEGLADGVSIAAPIRSPRAGVTRSDNS